jgi:hypothetical protein
MDCNVFLTEHALQASGLMMQLWNANLARATALLVNRDPEMERAFASLAHLI